MSTFDILVIDDEAEPRQAWFKEHLSMLGHTVSAAHSSSESYRLLRERRFDLAFFDHDLGETETGSTIAGQILYQPDEYQCPRAVWVHSLNSQGADNIASKFRSAGIPTTVLNFLCLKLRNLKWLEHDILTLISGAEG